MIPSYLKSVLAVGVVVLTVFASKVNSEPPVQNSGGGWGQMSGTYSQGYNQQQSAGGYSGGGSFSGGYGAPQVQNSNGGGGGWGNQQQQAHQGGGGGGWAQTQQAPQSNGGGWGQQQQQQQKGQQGGGGNGWGQGQSQNQMQKGQGNGWGPQLNFELDTANLAQNLNPGNLFRSITGLPRKIVNFIRESGLYLLFIPLLIILPLMLLAFNAGRLLGGLGWGWGWGKRSLASTVESGIVGYMKSPIWQKISETLMDEHVFESIMKSVDKFNKNKKDW